MTHKNKGEENIRFTGKSFLEYFESPDLNHCTLCGREDGSESVVLFKGIKVLVRVEIVEIVFDIRGFEYHFPICTEHLEMLQGIVSVAVKYLREGTGGVSITKY
jgi:hypothetical protein